MNSTTASATAGSARQVDAHPATAPGPGPTRPAQVLRWLVVTALAAGASLLISRELPLLGPLLVALVLGVVCANLGPVARHVVGQSPRLDKLLLRSGVVLLGLKVVVADVIDLGPGAVVVVLGTVLTTYAATQVVGRALGLDRELTTLIAAGFSICGAAAVAAVESSIRARPRDVGLAVALVTAFGSAMIVAVPTLGHVLGLDRQQTAVWAGASIHEVAQVIAAASLIGGGTVALATAMAVKLARVALLVPVQVASGRICHGRHGSRRGPLVPLFLVGFLAAVGTRATGVLSAGMLDLASDVTTCLFAAAMFGLGTTIVARQLWPVPLRALLLAVVSTVVAAGVSLVLVVLLG
ncbi:putative sulfate exporter family transporter [Nocardioides sp. JQ2195]|uniref:YeiH family protein n=1 Tax=Nocardioides sp. JQ2195 TaxID=2592334 RepID=UPI00143EB1C2|nr:putative sulfate exporter family transporter [Nocardioides sp. JQ2195]QIX27093.1 putative sulfate exporter family transporter [Nocardioides sp. JQ2195]